MSCVQRSEGVSRRFTPLASLVVPVIRSCQSSIWIWLVNYLHYLQEKLFWRRSSWSTRGTSVKSDSHASLIPCLITSRMWMQTGGMKGKDAQAIPGPYTLLVPWLLEHV